MQKERDRMKRFLDAQDEADKQKQIDAEKQAAAKRERLSKLGNLGKKGEGADEMLAQIRKKTEGMNAVMDEEAEKRSEEVAKKLAAIAEEKAKGKMNFSDAHGPLGDGLN